VQGRFLAQLEHGSDGTIEERWYKAIVDEIKLRGKFIADWSLHRENQG
jgi:hypothetical protein